MGVITFAGLQGLVNYLRRSPDTRLTLAQGLAMGLEFKLGSEILRTVIVRSLSEIAIVGSIIAPVSYTQRGCPNTCFGSGRPSAIRKIGQ